MAKRGRRFGSRSVTQDGAASVEIGGDPIAPEPEPEKTEAPTICETCTQRIGKTMAKVTDPRGTHECSRCRAKLLPGAHAKVAELDAERRAKRAKKP